MSKLLRILGPKYQDSISIRVSEYLPIVHQFFPQIMYSLSMRKKRNFRILIQYKTFFPSSTPPSSGALADASKRTIVSKPKVGKCTSVDGNSWHGAK